MYEVWFMNTCGDWSLEEVFSSHEEAIAYVDERWDYLDEEEFMEIHEIKR
jgi:hypothetical protein